MELHETTRDALLANRLYLIVCYRAGEPCTYQIYDGITIGREGQGYFNDGEDFQGNSLTYRFFLMPKTVR